MHIPIKVDYAVRALIDIDIYSNKIPARTSDISKRTYIPKPYLSQVLLTLKKNGLIKSYRGPKGGHVLAKNPSDITLEIIMNSIHKKEYFVNCLNLNEVNCCNYLSVCAQRKIWSEIESTMNSILNQTTIYDLVEQTFKLIPKSNEKKFLEPMLME